MKYRRFDWWAFRSSFLGALRRTSFPGFGSFPRLLARLLAGIIVFGLFSLIIATVLSQKAGPDPFGSPPGVDVHPGLNTAPVPCDWCAQETPHPTPASSKVSGSSTPVPTPSTVTVTVTAPAPSPQPP